MKSIISKITMAVTMISFFSALGVAHASQLESYQLHTLSSGEQFQMTIHYSKDTCNSISYVFEMDYLLGDSTTKVKLARPNAFSVSTIIGCPSNRQVPASSESQVFQVQEGHTLHLLIPENIDLYILSQETKEIVESPISYALYTFENGEAYRLYSHVYNDDCNTPEVNFVQEYLVGSSASLQKVVTARADWMFTEIGCPKERKKKYWAKSKIYQTEQSKTLHLLVEDSAELLLQK